MSSRLLGLLCLLVLVASPARAATSDTVTTYAGNFVVVDHLADGAGRVCGVTGHPDRIRVGYDEHELDVTVGAKAAPGTYPLTYTVCSGTAQTAQTITLVVAKPPRIVVRHLADGSLRARSAAPFAVRLTYGDFGRDDPEGTVTIPRNGVVVFHSRYHHVDWIARLRDGTQVSRGVAR